MARTGNGRRPLCCGIGTTSHRARADGPRGARHRHRRELERGGFASPSYMITDIIGAADGIGVENLQGSGMIAGETSQAYRDIFTVTLVTCRSVGIGAYLVRLGCVPASLPVRHRFPRPPHSHMCWWTGPSSRRLCRTPAPGNGRFRTKAIRSSSPVLAR